MLDFNFDLNHKCVRMNNITKMGVRLASFRFIDWLDLKIKNRETNQTRSVWFWTEANKVGYFFDLVWFEFSVLSVSSEPL